MNTNNSILVVDDTPDNLRLLINLLSETGYEVRPATSGQAALRAIQAEQPDLILLDIVMPGMDGYEVCQQLKANETTKDIPIIFVSAKNEAFDKVTAFSIGGVDYITKPFEAVEVLARVHTHLAMAAMQRNLHEKNGLLAQQNKELDAFAHTVAHDLKNPLSILIGYTDIMTDDRGMVNLDEIKFIASELHENARRAVNIIESLLILAGVRKTNVKRHPLDMDKIIDEVQERLKLMIADYRAEFVLPDEWPSAVGYAPWVEEIWTNYISNALKYGGKPPHLELGATIQPNEMIRFWIRDNGSGLTPEEQSALFTEFTRLDETRADGHGLGLSIVKRIVDKLDGQVGVTSTVGQGSEFYFVLPSTSSQTDTLNYW